MRRALGMCVVAAVAALGLSGCTPAQTEFWLVTDGGEISFASCDQFSIEALTLTARVNVGDDFEGSEQVIELNGPKVFFDDGESFSLASVADDWNAAEPLDMSADWYDLTLQGTSNGVITLSAHVDRVDLQTGEWTQLPQPGIGVASCDRA